MALSPSPPAPLLDADEPACVEQRRADGPASVVLVCDHASNRLPRCLANLGLTQEQLTQHIAWDPGASCVARCLSAIVSAPLVESTYSRLAIDCNRPVDSPESILGESAGIPIPGNTGLSEDERRQRIDGLFIPYHEAIGTLLDRRGRRTRALLSIHTFSPELAGQRRPWDVGVASAADRRLAEPLVRSLAADGTLHVGDNKPYAIDHGIDHTIPVHAEARGLAGALVEIRQDHVQSAADAWRWAKRLAQAWRAAEQALESE